MKTTYMILSEIKQDSVEEIYQELYGRYVREHSDILTIDGEEYGLEWSDRVTRLILGLFKDADGNSARIVPSSANGEYQIEELDFIKEALRLADKQFGVINSNEQYLNRFVRGKQKEIWLSYLSKRETELSLSQSTDLTQAEVAMVYIYLEQSEESKGIYSTDDANEVAVKFNWTEKDSGKKLKQHFNKLLTPISRTTPTGHRKSDNTRKKRFENVVKYLQDNGYSKALELAKAEQEVFLTQYDSLY